MNSYFPQLFKLCSVLIFIPYITQTLVSCQDKSLNYEGLITSNFQQLLVSNSDLQIIHDGIPSGYFTFVQDNFTPMTIVHIVVIKSTSQGFNSTQIPLSFVINVMRSRPGPTKISIWMATSLLSIKNETYPHIENYQYVSTHQYGFSCEPLCDNNQILGSNWNFVHSLINVYNILPTILDISQLLPRFNLRNDYGNFFTAHISQEGIQLCVRGTATVSLVLEDFTCRTLDDRRNLIDYGKLRGPPRTWTATFWADQKELETMEKLPSPKLNPFNSSRTYYFYDIPYYLAVVVVQVLMPQFR